MHVHAFPPCLPLPPPPPPSLSVPLDVRVYGMFYGNLNLYEGLPG